MRADTGESPPNIPQSAVSHPGAPTWPNDNEIRARVSLLKDNMATEGVDAMVLTSQHNCEYYTGYQSLFWLSDTRPFVAIVRRDRPGVLVVTDQMGRRSEFFQRKDDVTPSFYTGFTAAAMEQVGKTLDDLPEGSTVGFDYGADMYGRGSIALIDFLRQPSRSFQLIDAADLIWRQRMVKSPHEIEAKRTACNIATGAFFDCLPALTIGITEYHYGQILKQRMIALGADSVDWLPVRFGTGNFRYGRPNSDIGLSLGDFIWVDMGARRGEHISDVNRVAKAGKPTDEQEKIYAFVRDVTLRSAEKIRPGMTGREAFAIYQELWSVSAFLPLAGAGRVGHGSGMALTEPPSLAAESDEVIEENMILHIEPKLEIANGVFQNEEVFRVTRAGPEFLARNAPENLPFVDF